MSKGTLDGGHGVMVYHYGKQNALALWGSGPAYGMDANMLLSWHKYGGGKQFLEKLYKSIGANVVSFAYGPMPTQPFGWFKKPITKFEDLKGQKFRTVGISVDVFTAMGAAVNALPGGEIVPALDRGLLDGAEFNNASSDRLLGFPDVSKVCMLQSYHQNAESFEIIFNRDKFNALPDKLQALIEVCVEAASADMSWKAIDRYSKDYIEMQTKDKVKFYKTPDSILKKELEAYDEVAAKKAAENPLFKEIIESQKAFAKRAVSWEMDTVVTRRMAYNHYFGAQESGAEEGRTERLRVFRHQPAAIRAPPGWLLFERSNMQKFLLFIDRISAFVGKTVSWLIVSLTLLITYEVFSRYALNAPHPCAFDAHAPDVRDPVHDGGRLHAVAERPRPRRCPVRLLPAAGAGRPRPDAVLRLLPARGGRALLGRLQLAGDSWRILEHSSITAEGPPLYPFKTVIPVAGAFLLVQGIVEMIRCVICLKDGKWPPRQKDVEEVDVEELKELLGVKDEDIEKLDEIITAREKDRK